MRKKKRRLSVFIMVILILTVGMAGIRTAEGYAAWQQDSAGIAQGIATEIIRFHVRANSDSEADQQLKLQVKDRVVTYMEPLLRESQNIEQSRQILEEQTENIRTLALDTLREAGSDYDVAVYFENSYFPMKSYGDVTFPPGEYAPPVFSVLTLEITTEKTGGAYYTRRSALWIPLTACFRTPQKIL